MTPFRDILDPTWIKFATIVRTPAKAFLGAPAQSVVDQSGPFGDELMRKVAQTKKGPSKWSPRAPPTFPNGGPSGGCDVTPLGVFDSQPPERGSAGVWN